MSAPAARPDPQAGTAGRDARALLPLIIGQLMVATAMAGQRMASPLQILHNGASAWGVGLLLALFTVLPVLTAMATGRLADRFGYHRPLRLAVGLTCLGAGMALVANWLPADWQFALLCLAALISGGGANICGIATQRTGGHLATDTASRLRIFSWLAMAPAFANAVGPMLVGVMIDLAGFGPAYALLMILPTLALVCARRVPRGVQGAAPADQPAGGRLRELLAVPGMRRLLVINWLLSASWDVHSFAVPVLGHARGYQATTIGLVLGSFTLAVTLVRFIMPLLAHRVDEVKLLLAAMLVSGTIFAIYPFAATPWLMTGCAMLLGLTLGAVQPVVVATLYQLSPAGRHGEAIALRSMAISVSNSLMPLAFGAAGAAVGPGVVFWIMGTMVGTGSWATRGLRGAIARAGESARHVA